MPLKADRTTAGERDSDVDDENLEEVVKHPNAAIPTIITTHCFIHQTVCNILDRLEAANDAVDGSPAGFAMCQNNGACENR